jgi:Ran GTPase-activating protein (RanGAP) involved in mRNA processing and transport
LVIAFLIAIVDFGHALKHFRKSLITRKNLTIILNSIALTDDIFNIIGDILTHNHTIQVGQFARNLLTDKSAALIAVALEKNPALSYLDLTGNAFSDKGIELISEGLKLTKGSIARLILAKNRISDTGAVSLAEAIRTNRASFEKFNKLELSGNLIGDDGCAALVGLCQEAKTIASLQLNRNLITDKGADAVAKAIESNCGLREVLLSLNQISSKGAQSLATALNLCELGDSKDEGAAIELDLSQNQMIGRHGYSAFFQSDRPVHLELFRLVLGKQQAPVVQSPFAGPAGQLS